MSQKKFNRREFMLAGMLGTGYAGFLYGATVGDSGKKKIHYLQSKARKMRFVQRPGKRPHIFLFTVDMISPDTYLPSRAVSRFVNLPNIRSIADSGTRFDNALTTIPLCGPARAALFTGTYPPYLTNGERAPLGMKLELDSNDIIFQEYLRRSGYNTKHVGKCHVGIEKFMDAFGENDDAWNRWAPPLTDDDDYVAFLQQKGVKPPAYKKELRGLQADRKTPGNSMGGWIQQTDGSPFPKDAHYSVYLAEKALAKIKAAMIQAPKSPVYLQLDFFDPHQPFSVPAGFEDREAELRKHVQLPKSYRQLLKNNFKPLPGEGNIYEVYRQYWGAYDPDLVKDYIVAHILQMEVVDYAIGKLLRGIKTLELWDESVVIFTADHGEMNGRRGMFDKGVYFQPDVFRVPMMIKLPRNSNQIVREVKEPVSSLDISQTILDCARLQVKAHSDGETLLPVMRGDRKRTSYTHIFQTGWHVGVNYGIGINYYQDEQHHWFLGYNISTGQDELYNMAEDDGNNLSVDPAYLDVRSKMLLRMGEVLQSDRRWLGYWSTFRLHKARFLPSAGGDMQMFKPKE